MPQNFSRATLALVLSLLYLLIFGDTFFFTKVDILIPPLVVLLYHAPLSWCLWIGVGCGFLQDCIHSSPRLGFIALSYLAALLFLNKYKYLLFKDSLITLPIATIVFSVIATFLQSLETIFFDMKTSETLFSFITTICVMPIVDGIYALFCFGLMPAAIRGYMGKIPKEV